MCRTHDQEVDGQYREGACHDSTSETDDDPAAKPDHHTRGVGADHVPGLVVPGSGGHHAWALPDRPLGLFSDGRGCLTHAEGPPGAGGHMDGVHGMGPGAIMFTLVEHFRLTGDREWLEGRRGILAECVASLANRDHPTAGLRNGLMGVDSDRCKGGWEITTYDSLDASLGQARNSLYLGMKTWAAYVLLEDLLRQLGDSESSELAHGQAKLAAGTIAGSADSMGVLPAVAGENVPARIIPAIEGLAFPLFLEMREALDPDGEYGPLIRALERHFHEIMKSKGCRFVDGGWRTVTRTRRWCSWASTGWIRPRTPRPT